MILSKTSISGGQSGTEPESHAVQPEETNNEARPQSPSARINTMSAIAAKDHVTVEDYAQLPDGEWQKWELSDGELVPRYGDDMGARPDHNSVRVVVTGELYAYLRSNPVGRLLGEQDYELLPGVVRRPDISLVLNANLDILDENPAIAPGAPDIAIEIVSPSNRFDDVERKISQLLESGCSVVWVIQHRLQRALVCEPGIHREVKIGGALEAPDVLPGFRLNMKDLFERAGVTKSR